MEKKEMKSVTACGLYCSVCRKYMKGKCPGCRDNKKASWCEIRTYCIEHGYTSCADCQDFTDLKECKKFNNFVGKVMGVIFNSNRFACIYRIREVGYKAYAAEMEGKGMQTIKRR